MKNLTKRRLAFVVAAAMGIAGCGSDGKDGEDGAPGEPGEPGVPGTPVTDVSEITNVEYIAHMVEEGQVTVEFNLTDEDGTAITGLENAAIYLAAMTDSGIQRSRDGTVGGNATFGGDSATEGATITEVEDGQYMLVAPMAAVQADTEALIRLQVGDGEGIAASPYIIINKPENTHTSTTETCYSCHVDYATSDIKHSKYVALNTDGEVDFVGGCMVCHNNVPRDIDSEGNSLDTGGYAKNSMQKLGHINHQKFEKDFTPTNCYTCHAEPVVNTSIAGNGCSDCHGDGQSGVIIPADGFDAREFHFKSENIGLEEREEIRANHYTTTGTPYYNPTMDEWIDHKDVAWTSGYCVDIALFDNSGETPVQLNIGEMYEAHEVTYGGAYINNYHNDSIVARVISHGAEGYIENADGSRSVCYGELTAGFEAANLSASSRITIADTNWEDSDGEFGVSFTGYSDVVDPINFEKVQDWGRRHAVTADSCTTCHNNDTNYHKNGGYRDGGLDCVACHNNGQDRKAALSAPGFGPMVHSMHWGIGNALSGAKQDEEGNNVPNSADSLNADNCVSCHAEGISLSEIPNQYMLSKAFNGGTSGVMTSPVTANCFACHDSASALSHMETNGGELNVPTTVDWFTEGTSESCATCHDTGKSFGIDMFHNFER